ncbi:hypothetical protein N7532_001666 [Penicillium argentinense]|uniref:Uncharacterized protein n=1 Tax=Penicillium argentinense TaxID=1131581 RepID=A0A9W9G2Y0_9EURO|nr:uncharacterized protein N7532_001666 [Penicillium argentinense]KAJ5111131.1 hypothetical protein N7532_001666 [Penicillium argentinense]
MANLNDYDLEALDAKMQALIGVFESLRKTNLLLPTPPSSSPMTSAATPTNQLTANDRSEYVAGDTAAGEAVNEIIGRNSFASMLVRAERGKLTAMIGGPVDIGPDIRNKAKEL